MMEDRKAFILKAVIQDYIAGATPVGSNHLVESYRLPASPATVRNTLAELEEEGYLQQPHHSSGRIPTDRGYRLYVDALMAHEHLTPHEKQQIAREYEQGRSEIERHLLLTAKILSHLSGCAALVLAPRPPQAAVKQIELIPLDENRGLLILLSTASTVINRVIELPSRLRHGDLERLGNLLNAKLKGRPLNEIDLDLLTEWAAELHHELFVNVLERVTRILAEEFQDRVFVDGVSNLLEQPECQEIARVKPLLHLFEETKRLPKVFASVPKRETMNGQPRRAGSFVRIGHENRLPELREFTLIASQYYLADQSAGQIGIVGPTRMPYRKLIPMLNYVACRMNDRR